MDYDLMTIPDVVGAVPGDAAPLLVYPAKFTHKEIFQSTSVPQSVNKIQIVYATSVALSANQTISVEFQVLASESAAVFSDASGVVKVTGGTDPNQYK